MIGPREWSRKISREKQHLHDKKGENYEKARKNIKKDSERRIFHELRIINLICHFLHN